MCDLSPLSSRVALVLLAACGIVALALLAGRQVSTTNPTTKTASESGPSSPVNVVAEAWPTAADQSHGGESTEAVR